MMSKLLFSNIKLLRNYTRLKSTINEAIVITNNDTFVALHCEKDYPYEATRPLPAKQIEHSDSILKTSMSPELKQIYHKKNPETARQELMAITHTTKHKWFPRARDKRAKKTESDREYL